MSNPFSARRGPGIIELLRLTGFRSLSEFYAETNHYERELLLAAIAEYHDRVGGRRTL